MKGLDILDVLRFDKFDVLISLGTLAIVATYFAIFPGNFPFVGDKSTPRPKSEQVVGIVLFTFGALAIVFGIFLALYFLLQRWRKGRAAGESLEQQVEKALVGNRRNDDDDGDDDEMMRLRRELGKLKTRLKNTEESIYDDNDVFDFLKNYFEGSPDIEENAKKLLRRAKREGHMLVPQLERRVEDYQVLRDKMLRRLEFLHRMNRRQLVDEVTLATLDNPKRVRQGS